VRLSPLGNAATTGLLYQPQMINDGDCGAIGGMKIGRGNRCTRRKPAPAPVCPPQIPYDQIRVRTQAAAVGSPRSSSVFSNSRFTCLPPSAGKLPKNQQREEDLKTLCSILTSERMDIAKVLKRGELNNNTGSSFALRICWRLGIIRVINDVGSSSRIEFSVPSPHCLLRGLTANWQLLLVKIVLSLDHHYYHRNTQA
jgi:hypothetical protein